MFRSATFKLTMWYLAIVMAISLCFSVVLYHVAAGELDRGLHRETERIYTQFPVFENNPLLRPGQDYENGAHRILWRLVGFNIIVLVAAGGASYWLARRTLEPIEEAHEQQKRFTSDVSHELRTPLTALRMESEVALLSKKASTSELKQTLASNLEEVSKLEGLINNLLRLSRLEADELQQSFVSVSSTKIISEAIQQVEPMAKSRKVSIKHSGPDYAVNGDHDNLVQLLVILLDNAIKYSSAKSDVEVVSARHEGNINISIQDHGVGIERKALEHVFDRFYRSDSSRQKAGEEGYGLGLSIAKMIADVHNGNITISSKPGEGTKVSVSLPDVEAEPKSTRSSN